VGSKKLQLLILTVSFGLIYFIYQLPTSVIENKTSKEEIQKAVSVDQALSLIEGPNPMEGVFMLRNILENNPENTEALYYLGVLSNQTGQYQNALERFNQLIAIDSSDKRAYLQLGISNYNLGNKKKADSLFNIIRKSKEELLVKELDDFLNN
tara:strand:+ start:3193 stop:3651 length:459 start_codon:yes stop_codon:yes gene_type:complete